MKKIVIALDYDPTAQLVANAGLLLAKATHAEITLLHVIGAPHFYSSPDYSPIMGFSGFRDMDYMQADIDDRLRETAQGFLSAVKEQLADAAIQIVVKEGDVADSILQFAGDSLTDVIVIGSHSRRWVDTILMGSVTEKVLRHTAIPLYIVPTKQKK